MNVAGFVVTVGGPLTGGVGVGVEVEFVTVTVPVIPQHAPCGVQKYGNDPTVLKVWLKLAPSLRIPESQRPLGDPGVPDVLV
jgi:hypothetical protein